MALATRCPQCKTSFRVANDQLKLHSGLVRCGACNNTFNGIEHLLPPPKAATPLVAATPPAITSANPSTPQASASAADLLDLKTQVRHEPPTRFIPPPPAPVTIAPSLPSSLSSSLDFDMEIIPIPGDEPTEPSIDNDDQSTPEDSFTDSALPNPEQVFSEPYEDHAIVSTSASDDVETTHDDIASDSAFSTDADLNADFNVEVEANEDSPIFGAQDVRIEPSDIQADSGNDAANEVIMQALISAEPTLNAGNDEVEMLESGHNSVAAGNARNPTPDEIPDILMAASSEDAPERTLADMLDKPDFVRHAEYQLGRGKKWRSFMLTAFMVLIPGALGQAIYTFRDLIAASLPQTKPALIEACKQLRCEIKLPAQIDQITIESTELLILPNKQNQFSLSVQLRNNSSLVQAWPTVELLLNDAEDKPVLVKAFRPDAYLTDKNERLRGLAPNSEKSVKIYYELTGIKATLYHVATYY